LQFAFGAARRRNGECEDEQEGGRKRADTVDTSVSCCACIEGLQKNLLERMRAMRTHHKEKLKQEFVGVRIIGCDRIGEMPKRYWPRIWLNSLGQ